VVLEIKSRPLHLLDKHPTTYYLSLVGFSLTVFFCDFQNQSWLLLDDEPTLVLLSNFWKKLESVGFFMYKMKEMLKWEIQKKETPNVFKSLFGDCVVTKQVSPKLMQSSHWPQNEDQVPQPSRCFQDVVPLPASASSALHCQSVFTNGRRRSFNQTLRG
jgi:hypothetical protein